mmetsp:Transcript_84449/g.239531  ORF Transcript_84449/g.239531 Transcript_84449/m.239531 type:complete len:194 (+) Transcript_84449:123-704(+)
MSQQSRQPQPPTGFLASGTTSLTVPDALKPKLRKSRRGTRGDRFDKAFQGLRLRRRFGEALFFLFRASLVSLGRLFACGDLPLSGASSGGSCGSFDLPRFFLLGLAAWGAFSAPLALEQGDTPRRSPAAPLCLACRAALGLLRGALSSDTDGYCIGVADGSVVACQWEGFALCSYGVVRGSVLPRKGVGDGGT